MQARVTCPACQTALAVNASYGEGTVLRCPRCRHEFAVRFRPPPTAPADWPANDPLSAPPLAAPTPFQNEPSASQMRQPRLPPAGSPTEQGSSGGSMLWIGIGAGAAIAVACLVLMVIVMRLAMPAAGNGENLAGGDVPPAQAAAPAASPAADPLASARPPAAAMPAASSGAPVAADPASSGGPVVPISSIAPPASAAPPQTAAAPPLAYRFNSGEEYGYAFTVKAEVAGVAEQSSGMCLLSLSRDAVPAEFAAHNKSGQGSGSGFVVTSDGYVVTCAHVVEGSTKIDVALGGQNYPGQVVAFDKTHDLAVVRIVATNLPTIPLANSDSVELAQEVRAVGYPLSNVLGDSVKITRGSVAGVVNTEGRKLFQVDASINPGNSGGPLVNEMGQVIGVASAKLAGEDIDGVGFAVPANEVLALLRTKGLSLAAASGGTKLEGPALARRVTPAVAMLKVTIGPGGYGTANRFVLDFSGQISSAGPPRTVGNMLVPGTPKLENDRGKLLVSERGEMLDATGKVHLPHLLGLVGGLPIESLCSSDERTWQTQRVTALTQIIGQESNHPMPMRFRRRNPFAQNQTKIVVTPAVETCNYELGPFSGDVVAIKKRYVFQTLQPAGTPPTAQMKGEGTITFNRARGFAEKMEFKATLVRNTGKTSATIPLAMEWHRLDQAAINQARSGP